MPTTFASLAALLWGKGRLEEAVVEVKKAIALQPAYAQAPSLRTLQMLERGQTGAANTLTGTMVELAPDKLDVQAARAGYLMSQGKFKEALPALRRFEEMARKTPGHGAGFASVLIRETEQLLALEPRLPAFLKGHLQPQSPQEWERLLTLCSIKKLTAGAAQLYAEGFARWPNLAADLRAEHRSDAARTAVRAASGQGADAAKLDDKERARWRQQALDWLSADLQQRAEVLKAGSADDRAALAERLRWWQMGPALASVRDPARLAGLPAAEQQAWRALWQRVAAVREQVAGKR
jgi:hypothetical protein